MPEVDLRPTARKRSYEDHKLEPPAKNDKVDGALSEFFYHFDSSDHSRIHAESTAASYAKSIYIHQPPYEQSHRPTLCASSAPWRKGNVHGLLGSTPLAAAQCGAILRGTCITQSARQHIFSIFSIWGPLSLTAAEPLSHDLGHFAKYCWFSPAATITKSSFPFGLPDAAEFAIQTSPRCQHPLVPPRLLRCTTNLSTSDSIKCTTSHWGSQLVSGRRSRTIYASRSMAADASDSAVAVCFPIESPRLSLLLSDTHRPGSTCSSLRNL
jgi:hypothetical protein